MRCSVDVEVSAVWPQRCPAARRPLLGLVASGSMPDLAREPRPGSPGQIPQHQEIEALWAQRDAAGEVAA